MNLREMPWSRWLQVFVTIGIVAVLAALLIPAIQQARDAARKSTSKNNLKQLGIALHNYHDVHEMFPPGGVIDADGRGHHGWFTAGLPYYDASPLYSYIDFKYPWDDRVNQYVFRFRHMLALMPGADEQLSAERFALLHYLGNPHVLHRNSSVGIRDLEAGPSHTWLLGEAAGNYPPWGYPFNWRELGEKLNDGPNSFGRPTGDGAHLLMADGHVLFLKNDVAPPILNAIAYMPPIPEPKQTRRPDRIFKSARGFASWETESLTLKSFGEEGELLAVAHFDLQGKLHTVIIKASMSKFSDLMPEPDLSHLKLAVAEFPQMQGLCGAPTIDDPAAEVLSRLKELEFLQADSVDVSETGLESLKTLPRLRTLRAAMTEEMAAELSAALPDCEIQNTP